jgi:hypothetical protein
MIMGMDHYINWEGKALNKILELSAINKKGDSFPIELTPSNRARIFLCFH